MSAKNSVATSAKNSISKSGELLLYGEIGDWWDDLDALSVVRQLEQLDSDNITVRIHSGGGLIMEGLAIFNRLKESKARVTIYIDGLAASMASVVAMAGDRVIMPENAFMMIHKPWNRAVGNADEIRKTADTLDQFEESLLSIYESRTNLNSVELTAMMQEETWLSGADCIEYGFADELTEPIQAAASIELNDFNKAPKDKLKGLFSYAAKVAKPSEEVPMNEEEKKAAAAAKKADAENKAKIDAEKAEKNKSDTESIAKAAIEKERQRAIDIRKIGAQANMSDADINQLIDTGATVDQAKDKALEIVAERNEDPQPRNHIHVITDTGEIRAAITNAMMNRVSPATEKLTDSGRDFRGMNMMNMAQMVLNSQGVSTRGMTPMELAGRAMHTTSDFPLILADVANKTLRQGYEAAPRTFQDFTRQTSASDFKNINRTQLGEAPELEKVNEKGEFTYGTMGESNEAYKVETFGKIISLTRQTLINDDLDALSRIPMAFGASAAELESNTVWGLITGNVTMADSVALFHNTHKNLGTAGALSETTLSEARKKMRKQQGINAKRPMNLMPEFLIVPAALETDAQKIMASITPDQSGNVNPFANSLNIIVEPRLDEVSETAWYLSTSPSRIDTLEYAYLTGAEGVYIETEQGFDVDGVKIKARLDFGAGAIDFRGLFKNAGA